MRYCGIDVSAAPDNQQLVTLHERRGAESGELVESLEKELSDRTVGFRIEDEDLEDLKTVRDAVDYVVGRL